MVAPAGFQAAGVAAGIKPHSDLDLALVAAAEPAAAAAVFTVNSAAAAPIQLSRQHLAAGVGVRAVILNSGCANAATGPAGDAATFATAVRTASALGCGVEQVLVASTGPIGTKLPLERVLTGVDTASVSLSGHASAGTAAAAAILTTDTTTKEVVVGGDGFRVGGMAKGAGMVRPDMATMLAVLTTDAAVEATELDAALRQAVDGSFHGLNLDGCPSTNDMVVAIASGASGRVPAGGELALALTNACRELARLMAEDAEGASRVVTIQVDGAASDTEARLAGRAVADSALVRSAFYGGDPNWGRIVASLGSSRVPFDPLALDIAYEGIQVARAGTAVPFDAATLVARMAAGDFTVSIAVGPGPGSATVLTTDLTPEYVIFNAERS